MDETPLVFIPLTLLVERGSTPVLYMVGSPYLVLLLSYLLGRKFPRLNHSGIGSSTV